MTENDLWMIDNFKVHAAVNNHETEARYHLIFDMAPNEDTWDMLGGAESNLGYKDESLFRELWPHGNPVENFQANQAAQS
jgi:hypothetical protein